MKKLNYLLLGLTVLGMVTFTSCEPDEEAVGPSLQITSGEAVEAVGGKVTIVWRADAGDAKLASITIKEGNAVVNDGATTWDAVQIANSQDETYIDSVTLTVTEGTEFTIVIEDKDALTVSKTVTVTVPVPLVDKGSSQMGAAGNALGSYYSVANDAVYKTSEVTTANASKIDFVFDATASAATFKSPKDAVNTTVKASNRTTKYQKATFDFATATAAEVDAVTPTADNITVALNDVVVFVNHDNTKGVFSVSALTVATDGSVTIGIKVK